jgi:hypothetical protein
MRISAWGSFFALQSQLRLTLRPAPRRLTVVFFCLRRTAVCAFVQTAESNVLRYGLQLAAGLMCGEYVVSTIVPAMIQYFSIHTPPTVGTFMPFRQGMTQNSNVSVSSL